MEPPRIQQNTLHLVVRGRGVLYIFAKLGTPFRALFDIGQFGRKHLHGDLFGPVASIQLTGGLVGSKGMYYTGVICKLLKGVNTGNDMGTTMGVTKGDATSCFDL